MVGADDGVPDAVLGRLLVVQVGTTVDHDGVAAVDGEPLEAGEVVHAVLDQRPADDAAPALIAGVGLGQVALLGQEVLGREAAVLEVAEGAAVHHVGPALDHGVDHGARRPSELGVVLAGDDLELLDRLDRRPRLHAGALADDVVVVVAAVDGVVVVARILPVDADRVAAERLGADRGHDAGEQPDEADEVAVDARQVHQGLARDVAADLLRGDVDERRPGAHRQGLLHAAHLHRHVDGGGAADFELQVAPLEGLESLQRGGHLVAARDEAAGDEGAGVAGQRLAEHPGVLIPDSHGDARQRGARPVEHATANLRRPLLRTGRAHHQQPGEHPTVNTSTHQCLRRLTLVQRVARRPCRNTER